MASAALQRLTFRLGLDGILRLPRIYWVVWCGMLVSRVGRFVLPFLSLHLAQQGLTPVRIGWVVAAFGLGALAAAPLGGFLADRWGRRSTMLLGMLAGAVALAVFPLCHGWGLGAGALLMGLFTELPRPAISAVVADVVPRQDRYTAYALLYWAMNLAFAIAPVLGGALANRASTLLFWGDAAATALFAGVVILLLPETLQRAKTGAVRPPPTTVPGRFSGAYTNPRALMFMGLTVCVAGVFMQHVSTLSLALAQRGISPGRYGLIMCINGIIIVAVQPVATGLLNRRDTQRVLCCGAAVLGAGFAAQAMARVEWHFALCVVVWSLGELAFAPTASAYMAQLAPPGQEGRYQGAYQFAWGVAFMVGPLFGMTLLQHGGSTLLWLSCGAVVGVGVLFYGLYARRFA